jgi:hypothetical protein
MKLGLHLPATSWAGGAERLGSTLTEVCEAAEAAGFETMPATAPSVVVATGS